MPIITISGQIGAGAREAGRMAAESLGLGYIDHEILAEAAATLGVPMESVASLDERTLGFGERLASMMRRFLEQSAAAGSGDPLVGGVGLDVVLGRTYAEATAEGPHEVPPDRYLATMTAVILDVGQHGDVVIVGRGSQVILKDLPDTLHTLIIAPSDQRLDDTMRREGLSHDAALKRLHEVDKGRATFHRKFFKVDVDDPSLYHLTLNTGRMSIDQAAQAIADAVRAASRIAASVLEAAIIVLVSYLIGAIPIAYLTGRAIRGVDLREYGSKNVGASNVFQSVSKWMVVPVGLAEIAQGMAGILLAKLADQDLSVQVAAGLAAIAGHNWSPYLRFAGGRGVAHAIGFMTVLSWPAWARS